MSKPHKHTNRLIKASSPYLLQHAHNPVDWYEWGEEAFQKARAEKKLVLVSIGYSSCHWCHVMEHESFEKEDTADLMNEHFVCIKVDREERPDVDQLYMDAVQLLTGRGGWPLNMFVLPDGKPLHGGTYFPKTEWERTLKSLSDYFATKPEEALDYANRLSEGVKKLDVLIKETASFDADSVLKEAVRSYKANFDHVLGGYNWAPKFPMPNNWEFLLQYAQRFKDKEVFDAVQLTLTQMANGGINDQVGGGFARYSTDSYWKVPHFEKMLYDNAQLLGLYSKAYAATQNELFKEVVHKTHEFLHRELLHATGGYFSALDADSEGVEGKFYCWTKEELQRILKEDEPLFSLYYSTDAYGNWEHGLNILYKNRKDEELESLTGKDIQQIKQVITRCNQQLLEVRNQRIAPGLDDKIICSWNALLIKSYAEAALVFADENFLLSAKKCADFIHHTLWKEERLFRIYKDGKVSIPAFAEDYAAVIEAMLALYQAGGGEQYLLFGKQLLTLSLELFYDEQKGIFVFTSNDTPEWINRKTDINDDVIPSSNSSFAKCLFYFSWYFDQPQWAKISEQMFLLVLPKIKRQPTGFSNWLQWVLLNRAPFVQFIFSGQGATKMASACARQELSAALFGFINETTEVPLLKDKSAASTNQIYVCIDKTCFLPVQSVEAAFNLLNTN